MFNSDLLNNMFKQQYSIHLIFILALILRIYCILIDPYFHNWDEHFHALVGKNMADNPLMPVLRVSPILDYDYKAWCCNHVWLHKPPLAFWHIACSINFFGSNVFAVRFPSALLGALLVYPVYDIAKTLFNFRTAIISSLLIATFFFQIEQASGAIGMDHVDLIFSFYTTMSIWALIKFLNGNVNWKYLIFISLFSAFAVLTKWLVGLLVFSVWGFIIIARSIIHRNINYKSLYQIFISFSITFLIVVPWYWYIFNLFPVEAEYTLQYNARHFWESLEGHGGTWTFYLDQLDFQFGKLGTFLFFIGLFKLGIHFKERKQPEVLAILLSILIIFIFFSLAKTKLIGYTMVISSIIVIMFGFVIDQMLTKLKEPNYSWEYYFFGVFLLIFYWFRPQEMAAIRQGTNNTYNLSENRNNKIHNTIIYKQLNDLVPDDYIIFNCKEFEDVDAMFFSDRNVYHWWLSEEQFRELKKKNIKVALFKPFGNQHPPAYLLNDPDVLVIDRELK